jgi:hypothetical protein
LGLIAFTTVIARGVLGGSEPESTMLTATICMAALASAGYVVGRIAEQTIEESVRGKLATRLAAEREKPTA